MTSLLDEPDLDISTEHETMETSQEEERAARRERRERQKEEEDDPSLLDVQDEEEEEGPVLRSRTPTQVATDADRQETPTPGPSTEPEASAVPPPPPPTTMAWWMAPATWPKIAQAMNPAGKKIVADKSLFKNVEIKFMSAKPAANPSGAAGSSQAAAPNPSGGAASPSVNPSGTGGLSGQSDVVNGAYKAVFSTRLSCRTNPVVDEEGGSQWKKLALALSPFRVTIGLAFVTSGPLWTGNKI